MNDDNASSITGLHGTSHIGLWHLGNTKSMEIYLNGCGIYVMLKCCKGKNESETNYKKYFNL